MWLWKEFLSNEYESVAGVVTMKANFSRGSGGENENMVLAALYYSVKWKLWRATALILTFYSPFFVRVSFSSQDKKLWYGPHTIHTHL